MKNANELKEKAIQDVKNQLEVRRLRVEDESVQQGRSEPESTLSDLTDSSISAKMPVKAVTGVGDDLGDTVRSRKAQRLMVSHPSTLSSADSSGAENEARTAITNSTTLGPCGITGLNGNTRLKRISSLHVATGNFDLDFQEVFIKSSIPQLLATDSGKIVACE
jgi:hypothetical protein